LPVVAGRQWAAGYNRRTTQQGKLNLPDKPMRARRRRRRAVGYSSSFLNRLLTALNVAIRGNYNAKLGEPSMQLLRQFLIAALPISNFRAIVMIDCLAVTENNGQKPALLMWGVPCGRLSELPGAGKQRPAAPLCKPI
jgi:hypothetical protein